MSKIVYFPQYMYYDSVYESGECFFDKEKAEKAVEELNSEEHKLYRYWSVQELVLIE